MNDFKISLKAARVNKGLTAKETAEKMGKTEKTILNWENSLTTIPTNDFYNLCELYGIDPDYVVVPINLNDKADFF